MEDLPIGAEVVLKVVETKEADCTGCFFDGKGACEVWRQYPCAREQRSDRKNVIFKEVKE